jgi:hypothetical protein
MRFEPMIKNNPIPKHLVTTLRIFVTVGGSFRIRKSTKIWPFTHEVKGIENPMTTAPEKATSS